MKQKTKRILAFAMAVVFALSTGVTSSPYTVMATEAGETIAPLAEEGSGSGEVTPGTTETGTSGGSGEGGISHAALHGYFERQRRRRAGA